ncbi:MAG: hypothetical protein AAF626_16045 [Pseudomonadota bacterium]
MTALADYQRLEAPGIWRAAPGDQRRDVIVSLGDATLVIYDGASRPLAHWSLPAVERLNPGEAPALYRPGPDSPEDLELTHAELISAIERVGHAVARNRAQRGRLRLYLALGGFLALAALGVFWLPDVLIRHTASVVPEATRAAIGTRLQTEIQRFAGPPCQAPLGSAALRALAARLGQPPEALVVLPAGIKTAAHLPGGTVLLNRALVEDYEDPLVVAGYVLAETTRAAARDPVEALLRETGAMTAFRLLTTGDVPSEMLSSYAQVVTTAPPGPVDTRALLAAFADTGVPASPYAYAVDITGERTLGLIEADPVAVSDALPVLRDSEWVSLQSICGE